MTATIKFLNHDTTIEHNGYMITSSLPEEDVVDIYNWLWHNGHLVSEKNHFTLSVKNVFLQHKDYYFAVTLSLISQNNISIEPLETRPQ